MDLAARRQAVEPKYQAALADLDGQAFEEMELLVRELREAGMVNQGHHLGGRWRQNRYHQRQLQQETGTAESSSPQTSEPAAGSSSGNSSTMP